MVMAPELSAILGLHLRATGSSYRTAIYRSEDLTNQTSVMVQHYVRKTARVTPWANAETIAAWLRPDFALQVSAKQFPTAIEIRMIPDDRLTSAAPRVPLEIPTVDSRATVEP